MRAWEALKAGVRRNRLYYGVTDNVARLRLASHRAGQLLRRSGPSDDLAAEFERIQKRVRCAHSLEESLFIMELILKHRDVPGDLVECGVFKGGMTAKWSLLARHLDRTLYAYDSYTGLPDPARYGTGGQVGVYMEKVERGDTYRGSLEEVRANVAAYGHLESCRFVKGWFEDSFGRAGAHPAAIAFAFLDVDLTLSFRQCLEFVWPRLSEGGILFSHEARDPEIAGEIARFGLEKWEHQGVGSGLGPNLDNLCWVAKR